MHLRELTVTSYKSFFESTRFVFERGFNLLVGSNSSGKSSVLEAIEFQSAADRPHRSVKSIPTIDDVRTTNSVLEVSFAMAREEISKVMRPVGSYWIGLGTEDGRSYATTAEQVSSQIEAVGLQFDYRRTVGVNEVGRICLPNWPSRWRQLQSQSVMGCQVNPPDFHIPQPQEWQANGNDISSIARTISSRIYRFAAERKVVPRCGTSSAILTPDSANLAFCLNHLQTSAFKQFEVLNDSITRIFPTIQRVSAIPTDNGQFELSVQTTGSSPDRADLRVPIDQVGTGVFNAVAMLYVATTTQLGQIILLEEPNSFLHPRALRELLAILREVGSRHQFFITTHSSDVLRSIEPSSVTLLEFDGVSTSIKQSSGTDIVAFREGLIDLGIRLTDLHGCDRVLWVEGETEEAVFPLLLRSFFPKIAEGTAVLPLHATGDFEAKKINPKKIAEIYKMLSQRSFLVPPMVGITLDRENKPASLIGQIERDCNGLVHFLNRPMLEDYLLDEDAIAAVLSKEAERVITPADVMQSLSECEALEANRLNPMKEGDNSVHAAKVLDAVFKSYLVGGPGYQKVHHGGQITKWLIANKPTQLDPLVQWLTHVLRAI
jgi:predicted ATPase